jgi:hypothetical protein
MNAATTPQSSSKTHRSLPSPFPTPAALALEQVSLAELERVFLRGTTPDADQLVGWEFRGINHPWYAPLLGIKKFVKGFYRGDDGRAMGFNRPVVNNALDGRWHVGAKRFGFFEVHAVDATSRDNAHLHATLIDYSRGGNKPWDVTGGLRDYLVQVDPSNPDLFLGKAYYALGPVRVPVNFFILERFRPSDFVKR